MAQGNQAAGESLVWFITGCSTGFGREIARFCHGTMCATERTKIYRRERSGYHEALAAARRGAFTADEIRA